MHGLKPLAERLVDRTAALLQDTLHQDLKKQGWTWGTVPFSYQPYVMYSALDPVLTVRLFEIFWEKVKPGAQFSKAYELEMQTRRIATEMELRGARIDPAPDQHIAVSRGAAGESQSLVVPMTIAATMPDTVSSTYV